MGAKLEEIKKLKNDIKVLNVQISEKNSENKYIKIQELKSGRSSYHSSEQVTHRRVHFQDEKCDKSGFDV